MDDMSNIVDKLSNILSSDDMPDNIKELINGLKSANSTSNDDSQNTSNENNIDIDMIFKAKKIMESISNNNDPRQSLLLSLKPYLKDDKKEKIDQYIKFLSLSKILETMGPEMFGSDKNVK